MNEHEYITDEEVIAEVDRAEMLTSGALAKPRTIRDLVLRPPTMESMSYLWELKNFFIYRDAEGNVYRNNPILGIAEFVFVHHAPIKEVSRAMAKKDLLDERLREYMNGSLSGLKILEEAMPVIESMLSEYAAAQSEVEVATSGTRSSGKE